MIQRLCSRLPGGDQVYYQLQRRFGGLRAAPDPIRSLRECALMIGELGVCNVPIADARILEVGTGRLLEVPLGFYLGGATGTTTVDLNRYLKSELVMESIQAMSRGREALLEVFRPCSSSGLEERFDRLVACGSLKSVLSLTGITYLAPADARHLPLEPGSVDIHTSYTVFEHIPRAVLVAILKESSRLLAAGGVALHRIDLSDHYAHDDPSISYINFLQYSSREWRRLADNRFAYHNRLRPADYRAIYREAGHEVLDWTERRDARSAEMLRSGFKLDAEFQGIGENELGICGLRVISRQSRGAHIGIGAASY
jgi:hypothetical protein